MSGFGEYAPNMVPTDALVVRDQAEPAHELVQYTGEDLARPRLGPSNPFRDDSSAAAASQKRKNVLTGFAEETFVSEHTFRSKHRAVERRGGPEREFQSGADVKAEAARIRKTREGKGSALVAEGDGEYKGPWASYKSRQARAVEVDLDGGGELGSDEEYEIVEVDDDEDEDVVESGAVVQAPAEALARRQQVEDLGDETTTFHGSELHDYQGRTYMHVPQDLDIDLRKEPGSTTNYIPKKLVHQWKHHTKAITSLNFFPNTGHLLLSGSADSTVKIWDVYHQRELLRTYSGHSKSLSDTTFNTHGDKFLSASFDRMMKLWDTETGKCISKFTTGKTPHVVRFNPTSELGHEFVAGMSDNKIVQFDTRAGNETVQEYDHHLGPVNTITFCDEGRRFMTTSDDRTLRAWEYGFGVPIKYIAEPYLFAMTRAATHPSGKYVAYQSSDNQVVVYSSNDKFRQNRKKSYRGHNNAGSAIDIDISADGQFLASGDTAGFVAFWDWKSCKMFHKIQVEEGQVSCVKWHPQESSKVATGGASGIIKFWD